MYKDTIEYELIVIGAGPAGALAAYEAAKAGVSVLIIEKTQFPRVKPCAGGLTGRSLHWLPFSVADVIEADTNDVNVAYGYDDPITLTSPETFCAFVCRDKFDKFLLDKAVEAGAEVRFDLSLSSLDEEERRVKLGFKDGAELYASYVVGADGANSTVRKLMGDTSWVSRGFALEGLVPKSSVNKDYPMQFDMGVVDGGYGWIFPKADHYNVGLYITSSDYSISREGLVEYTQRRMGTDDIRDVVGFNIGSGAWDHISSHRRTMLVGDAAGMAELLLGEGLHHAILSGVLAGKAVAYCCNASWCDLHEQAHPMLKVERREVFRLAELAHDKAYPLLMKRKSLPKLQLKFVGRPIMRGTSAGLGIKNIMNNFIKSWFIRPKTSATMQDVKSRRSS